MERRSGTVVMLKCLLIMAIAIATMDASPAIMSIDPESNVEELNYPSGTNNYSSRVSATNNATILEEFIYDSMSSEGLNNTNYSSASAIRLDTTALPPSIGPASASLMPWTPFRGSSDLELTTVTLIKESTSNALKETIVTPEPKAGGYASWFVLMLDGNCSLEGDDLDNLKERLAGELVVRLRLRERSLAVRDTSCSSAEQMHINVTIDEPCANLSALLATDNDPSGSSPLVRIKHHDYYVHQVMTADGFLLSVEPDMMVPVDMSHTDVELIVYIAVGSACAFLVLLVAGLLTFKYCDRSAKPGGGGGDFFDYRDVLACNGRLQNMHRLEDYTLTRIPRPKLSCIDYCKSMSSSAGGNDSKRYSPLDEKVVEAPRSGMVRPFDTSVVPLEDAFPGDSTLQGQGRIDGVIVRPMDIRRYASQNFTRFYRNGRGLKSPAATAAAAAGRSTENLQQPDADNLTLDHGLDNPIYH